MRVLFRKETFQFFILLNIFEKYGKICLTNQDKDCNIRRDNSVSCKCLIMVCIQFTREVSSSSVNDLQSELSFLIHRFVCVI